MGQGEAVYSDRRPRNPVTESDLLGKRSVLWFYPKADTPG